MNWKSVCALMCLLAGVAMSGQGLKAQTVSDVATSGKKNLVTYYPGEAVFGNFKIGYERSITPSFSLRLNAGYRIIDESNLWDVTDLRGINIDLQPRYYLSGTGRMTGFHASPYFTYQYMDYMAPYSGYYTHLIDINVHESTTADVAYVRNQYHQLHTLTAGLLVGYQFLLADRIYLDVYGGSGFHAPLSLTESYRDQCPNCSSYEETQETHPLETKMILPRLGFSLGIAF